MTEAERNRLLEELRTELEKTGTVDEKGRALLRDLRADIEVLLERSGEPPRSSDDTTIGRFRAAIDHFEVTHPSLTAALSRMMDTLSNAGI
jgi:hypothetical protein